MFIFQITYTIALIITVYFHITSINCNYILVSLIASEVIMLIFSGLLLYGIYKVGKYCCRIKY